MECLRLHAWDGQLHHENIDPPACGPRDVVVSVDATGVGRTVHKYINGGMGADPAELPRIPGHEVVGTVIETGAGVDTIDVDDRVVAYFHIGCRTCRFCLAGRDPLCSAHRGHVGVVMDGGFSDRASFPVEQVVPIPTGIDPIGATAIPDAIATPYHVFANRVTVTPATRVAVLGAGGGVGIHALQIAVDQGAHVTAVDITTEKLDACEAYGADETIDTSDHSLRAARPFDVIVDFTGEMSLLENALESLSPEGTLVNLTSFSGRIMEIEPRLLTLGERTITGSRYCDRDEVRAAAELVTAGRIEPVVSETVGYAGVTDLLEEIVANQVIGRGAMQPM